MQKKWLVASVYETSVAKCAHVDVPLTVHPTTSFLLAKYLKAKLPCAHLECTVHLTLLALLLHVLGDHCGVQYVVICHGERCDVASVKKVFCGTTQNCLHNTNQREAPRTVHDPIVHLS